MDLSAVTGYGPAGQPGQPVAIRVGGATPAATAMAAVTLDYLSGGRLLLGAGVSGPQVVEGWYGTPFAQPLARTREYVDLLRVMWRRQRPGLRTAAAGNPRRRARLAPGRCGTFGTCAESAGAGRWIQWPT